MTDPKNDNSRARTPTPCWPVGWWIQRCHQGAWRKWRRRSRSQPCGRPSRPSRVAWARGGCLITAVWVSIPFPLGWSGLGVGAGRGFCTHSSVPGVLQSSAAPESSPGWTVSKETWKGVGNLDRICWSLLTWKKSEYFAVISSAQTSFPAALAPKELGLRAAGQWGSPGLLY